MCRVIASVHHTHTHIYKACDIRANEQKTVFKQNAHDSPLIWSVRVNSERPWNAFRARQR